MARAYRPEAVFARFAYQIRETYPHRIKLPNSPQRLSFRNIRRAVYMLCRIIWEVGVRSNYRKEFWKFARPLLRRGDIENLIAVPLVAHHLIMFARDAVAGRRNASHYSARLLEPAIAAE